MTSEKTKKDFERELAEIRKMLGRDGAGQDGKDYGLEAGIKGDFELPYSTLPKLRGESWNDTETFA